MKTEQNSDAIAAVSKKRGRPAKKAVQDDTVEISAAADNVSSVRRKSTGTAEKTVRKRTVRKTAGRQDTAEAADKSVNEVNSAAGSTSADTAEKTSAVHEKSEAAKPDGNSTAKPAASAGRRGRRPAAAAGTVGNPEETASSRPRTAARQHTAQSVRSTRTARGTAHNMPAHEENAAAAAPVLTSAHTSAHTPGISAGNTAAPESASGISAGAPVSGIPVSGIPVSGNSAAGTSSAAAPAAGSLTSGSQGAVPQAPAAAGPVTAGSSAVSAAASSAQPHQRPVTPEGTEIRMPDGKSVGGILELMPDGFGFIRSENFLPGDNDVYVNPSLIKRYGLRTGDVIRGISKSRNPQERYNALMFIETVNKQPLSKLSHRTSFENLTPIFPNQRIHLETDGVKAPVALRVLDLLAPIGKGQRGMIVSPPKAGKTTLLKQVAKAIVRNEPKMHLLILLIDERPEEVTDMKEEVEGGMVQVIYSTFDETPEHHKRVAEMTIEHAKRLVEQGEDVTILLDSITRLARAYNLVVPASGRTLSGGLDPAALHMPKRFFGAARNIREGGSLTILATALVDTGSRMDDVIYEEFKGTGNMELVLNRELQEKRIFPAIDILKSGTRRDDLLLSDLEQKALDYIHKRTSDEKNSSAVEEVLQMFERTESNNDICQFLVNSRPLTRQTTSNPNLVVKINR